MRPGDGVDAVDLDEPDPLDQVVQGLARGGAPGRLGKRVAMQEQGAGAEVRDQGGHPQAVTLQTVSANARIVTFGNRAADCIASIRAYYLVVS